MKRILALALVLAVVWIAAPLFAYEDIPTRMIDVQIRKNTFDYLAKQTYADLSISGKGTITPTDSVSTGTSAVNYQGTVEPPFLVRVQNLGLSTVKVYYCPYVTDAAGVTATTATCSYLTDGKVTATPSTDLPGLSGGGVWEKVFYQNPNLSFGGQATVTISIFTRPSQ
jgi:hypothetical protein